MLHSLVYKHGVAPRKIAVKCNSHHRQGVSLSADGKPWIDFKKLALRIYFVRVCYAENPHESLILADFCFFIFHEQRSANHTLMLKTGIIFSSVTFCLQPFHLLHHQKSIKRALAILCFTRIYDIIFCH